LAEGFNPVRPEAALRLNARHVSQLDGLPVRYAGLVTTDPLGTVRVWVPGYHSSMLFFADEVVGV
jgi:hypothetical protein